MKILFTLNLFWHIDFFKKYIKESCQVAVDLEPIVQGGL